MASNHLILCPLINLSLITLSLTKFFLRGDIKNLKFTGIILSPPPFTIYSESHSVMSNSLQAHGLWNAPGQGIFPTQESNPGLPHCRLILYQLSHQGSPRILEWASVFFSSRSSQPRNWTGASCIAVWFFTNWTFREAQKTLNHCQFPSSCLLRMLSSLDFFSFLWKILGRFSLGSLFFFKQQVSP